MLFSCEYLQITSAVESALNPLTNQATKMIVLICTVFDG